MLVTKSFDAGDVLFGRSRRGILNLLFADPGQSFYLREIVRLTGCGTGPAQRELKQLAGAGIVDRRERGRQVFYQANRGFVAFDALRALITRTVGIAEPIRRALAPLARMIRVALVFGSTARGEHSAGSDIDILIVGAAKFAAVVGALHPLQSRLGREINPVVFTPHEYSRRLAARDRLLANVLAGPKIFVIGSEDELRGLGKERLAQDARARQRRRGQAVRAGGA